MILRDQLELDQWYEVRARNFDYALWTGIAFLGRRGKFGHFFWAEELHWDDSPHYGTAKPIRKVTFEELPNEIAESYLAYRRTHGDAGSDSSSGDTSCHEVVDARATH